MLRRKVWDEKAGVEAGTSVILKAQLVWRVL
jgi:hypothetical protein